MKRLITYLKHGRSVMTLLLLFGALIQVCADQLEYAWNGSNNVVSITYPTTSTKLQFRSDVTGWDSGGDMTASADKKTWTYTLDMGSNLTQDIWFRFVGNGETGKDIFPDGGDGTVVIIDNPTGVKAVQGTNSSNKNFKFTGNGKYTKYEIKVTLENDNNWYVYVKGTETAAEYSIESGKYTAKGSASNGKYNFALPASCYKDGKISFNISKTKGEVTTYLTSSDLVFDNHNNNEIIGVTDNATAPVDFTYTTSSDNDAPSGDISVVYDPTAGKLTLYYESAQDIIGYSYYLIVPDENVGNTGRTVEGIAPAGHKAFRFQAGRKRDSNDLMRDLTTLTLKIDGKQLKWDENDNIKFYIRNGEGTLFLQPVNNDDDREIKQTVISTNEVDRYGIRVKNMAENKTDEYYIIKKSEANTNGDTKSLTFMFSKDNAVRIGETGKNGNSINSFAQNGNLIVGFLKTRGVSSDYYKAHISNKTVYLVGSLTGDKYLSGANMTNPNPSEGEEPYYDKSKFEMKPNYWYDGVIDNGRTDIANADSIVYSCEIRKGSANWDNFFLSFTTSDVISGTYSDGKENQRCLWNRLLRPHVQDQMDGQALEGGIFYFKDVNGVDNQQQSLNPLLTAAQKARYASYRVFFNATYSTYRIEFYDQFCIGGPAVNGLENSNVNSGEYFDADHRHGMIEETINGVKHYRYRGEFKQGSTFAFFVNPETSVNNYSENSDFEAVNNNKKDGTNYNGMWETQAPVKDGVATKADYPFHNKVRYNTTGGDDNQSLGEGNNGILWTLPSGVYTIRFYNHEGIDEENTNALYTVDKEVVLNNATSTYVNAGGTDETENLGGLRTFSDDCALWLPSGVQAYYVPEIKEGRAVLREVKDGIIPAHWPVLIYDRNQLEGTKTIHLYPVPGKYTDKYTDKITAGEPNLLVDRSLSSKVIQPIETVDGKTKYNFYMTNKYYLTNNLADREYRAVPLNFWKARPGSTAKKNYTYLSVDDNIFPVSYVGDKNYEYEKNRENFINDARSYCFILSIGNVDDNNVITGITSVETDDNKVENNVWYTIQGIKVASPVMPGLYIHNGKKVIIK